MGQSARDAAVEDWRAQVPIAYFQGRYDQCRRLLTSPRMNKAQREVIEEEAYSVKDELEALGVKFSEAS